jgi:DNA ligase 1
MIAEYGHGKRAGVLSDYTFAVRQNDDMNSELRIIGSGLTDTSGYKKIKINYNKR